VSSKKRIWNHNKGWVCGLCNCDYGVLE